MNPIAASDMKAALADVFREHGLAVRTYGCNNSREFQITVSEPTAPLRAAMTAEIKPIGDPSFASSWTEPLKELQDTLMNRPGAHAWITTMFNDCMEALVKVSRDHQGETIRGAYEKTHPHDKFARFINPLMSFEDVLRCTRPFDDLIGVQDSRLHENVFQLVADKYGMPAQFVKEMAREHMPLVPRRVFSEIECAGAFLNETTSELAVSFLSYNDPEVLVFDCTAGKLAQASLSAVREGLSHGLGQDAMDLLNCQNLIDSREFGDCKASHRSVAALAEGGFFSAGAALTDVSEPRNLIELVYRETGLDIRGIVDEALATSPDQEAAAMSGVDDLSSLYAESAEADRAMRGDCQLADDGRTAGSR